ncbi:MAG: hypothetical protein PUJ05_10160 [Clostridium sp.]|uniref:hypothetical protein n=1 Tax=Clostridium sp. TaxID=1506 RepID=UPI0026712960|nr:hypothetical protein [Clostridium sp.]MDD7683296.1 hypothetical protein [Clostridium sp.]MDY2579106.1 hypothetical protein [Clostridium sp.]
MSIIKKIKNVLYVAVPIGLFAFGQYLNGQANHCKIISSVEAEAVVTDSYAKKEYEEYHKKGKTLKRELTRYYIDVNYENYQSTFSTLSEVKSSKESRNAEKGSKVKAYLMTVEYKGKEYIYLDDDTSVSNSDIMYIKSLE